MGGDIFSIEPVQLQFSLNNLKRLRISDNILILLTLENQLIRLNLKNPELVDKFKIKDKIKDVYLSHEYLIITTYQNTHYFLSNKNNSIHSISKLKNVMTSYIRFVNENVLLIGTEKGEIYQFNINKHKLSNSTLSLVWRNPINQNNHSLISGLHIYDNLLFVIQKNDIFYYSNMFTDKGNPDFQSLLNSSYSDYENFEAFDEFNNSCFFSNEKDFAWLIKNGIIFTNLKDRDESSNNDKLMDKLNYLLNIQLSNDLMTDQITAKGKNIMITDYHLIYLNENHLTIVNKINYEIVFDANLPLLVPNESYQGMSSDNKTFWIYSNYNIYELVINNECKNIWKLYLQKNDFEEALKYTRSSINLDLINLKYSNYLIMKKQYLEASNVLAKTSEYFEFACLDLFNDKPSLLNYLKLKLSFIDDSKKCTLQKIVISSLILEVYMEQIIQTENGDKLDILQANLKEFLTKNKGIINKDIAYQIFQNYNSMETLLFFGELISDYEFILKYLINLEKYKECLKILSNLSSYEMVYKYANILLTNEPLETIYLWVDLHQKIDCEKLVPAILNYNKLNNTKSNEDLKQDLIIKYLKFLIFDQKAEQNIIHNTYLSVIILKNCESSKSFILEYFETLNNESEDNATNKTIYFDTDYILRLLLKFDQIEPAIHLYSMVNDFECSIRLAIEHNLIDLACLMADKSYDKTDNTLKKKIWMEISKKMIQRFLLKKLSIDENRADAESLLESKLHNFEMDILNNDDNELQKLLEYLLGKCDLLTIQDLLPLFPEFQSINNFKKEIIKSLENYGIKLNQLNSSIQSSIKFNENLVENLKELQSSRHFLIDSSNYNCEHCKLPVVLKKFISFPCHHNFHIDCILNLILNSRNQNFYKLKKQITMILKNNQISAKSGNGKIKIGNGNAKLLKELEPLLCEKCLVCNDANIDSIEEGFIIAGDKKLAEEWKL